MSLDIWTDTDWAKGGYGGWAFVRIGGTEAQGVAGGDRRTTPLRMALTGAIEALTSVGKEAGPVRLRTPERALITGAVEDRLPEDKDLWDRLAKLIAARTAPVSFVAGDPTQDLKTIEFAHGWAAFAMDIAKTKGTFSSAIPKPNLKALLAKR